MSDVVNGGAPARPRDGHSSGGLFSKASNSLRKSPRKKHQYESSTTMPGPATVNLERAQTNGYIKSLPARHGPTHYRPGLERGRSTPLDVHTIKSALQASKDEKLPHSAVEATTVVSPLGHSGKREASSSLGVNRSAGEVLGNQDRSQLASLGSESLSRPGTMPTPVAPTGSSNPQMIYQHIHDFASKSISTLEYMRKA